MKNLIMMAMTALALIAFNACQITGSHHGSAEVPNLKGEWKVASYSHHHAKHGYMENLTPEGTWTILDQQGHHFNGERTYQRKTIDGKTLQEGFSGVISACNRRIYIIDHAEDMAFGDIISDDEIVVYILGKTHADKEPRAGYIVLKKVK
jgi:hypothetical protein